MLVTAILRSPGSSLNPLISPSNSAKKLETDLVQALKAWAKIRTPANL